jgi:hypothetical protein
VQPLAERHEAGQSFLIVRRQIREHADAAHPCRLLRARRERPCSCRAAEQRDEIAAFQLTKLHPLPLAKVTA